MTVPDTQRTFGNRFALTGDIVAAPLYDEHVARDLDGGIAVGLWVPRPALFAAPVARDRLRRIATEVRAVIHPGVRRLFAVGDAPSPWITYQPATPLRLGGTVARDQLVVWLDAVAGGLRALHAAGLVHGGVLETDVVAQGGELRIGGAGVWACADPRAVAAAAAGAPLAPERARGAPASAASDAWSLAHLVARWAGGPGPDPVGAVRRRHPKLAAELGPMLAVDPGARRDLAGFVGAARAALATPFTDERPVDKRQARRRKRMTTEERTAIGHASPDETTERTAAPREASGQLDPPMLPAAPAPVAPLHAVSMKPGGPDPRSLDVPTPPAPTPQIPRAFIRQSSPVAATAAGALGRLAPPRTIAPAVRHSRRRAVSLALVAALVIVAAVLAVLVAR